jgi:hypothetical protein
MQLIIFPAFFSVILLCSLWFHDVWFPPEGRAERKKWNHAPDDISEENTSDSEPVALLQPANAGKDA